MVLSQAYHWLKYGASDNHYYSTVDKDQLPIRYMEHKNEKLKQWDFDLFTYQRHPEWKSDNIPAYFNIPTGCITPCGKSPACDYE